MAEEACVNAALGYDGVCAPKGNTKERKECGAMCAGGFGCGRLHNKILNPKNVRARKANDVDRVTCLTGLKNSLTNDASSTNRQIVYRLASATLPLSIAFHSTSES